MRYATKWFGLLLAVMVLPCFSVAIVQFSTTFTWYPAWPDFLRAVLLSVFFLVLFGFFYYYCCCRNRLWLYCASLFSIILIPVADFSIIHILLYKIPINFYTIQAILETSPSEAASAIETLSSPILFIVSTLLIVAQIFMVKLGYTIVSRQENPASSSNKALKILIAYSVIGLATGTLVAKSSVVFEKNALLRSHFLSRTAIEYQLALRFQATTRELILQARLPVDFGPMRLLDSAERRTYVVILGESASRHHLSLYGYPRPTTRPLDDIRDHLVIWNQVVSMFGMTSPSLNEALIFHDLDIEQGVPSMLALHREAGFKTFWLTNTTSNTMTGATWFDIAADTYVRTNVATRFVLPTPFDEALLPELEQALDDAAPNKFIVIHLSGSHFNYRYRYPEDSAIFGKNDIKDLYRHDKLSKSEIIMVNEYDNSVHYTSTIVKKVIDFVSSRDANSYVLYLSDHGQQLFETEGTFQAQHAVGETRYMYDVPFFAWFSESYKRMNPVFIDGLLKNTEKFAKLDDSFCHGLAELSRIHFSGFNDKKSLFSWGYVEPNTILGSQVDYSKLLH